MLNAELNELRTITGRLLAMPQILPVRGLWTLATATWTAAIRVLAHMSSASEATKIMDNGELTMENRE